MTQVNNEEKILSMLELLVAKVDNLDQRMDKLEQRQDKLEQGLADLRAEMNRRFDELEFSLENAWKDIGLVEDRVVQHEREFHGV